MPSLCAVHAGDSSIVSAAWSIDNKKACSINNYRLSCYINDGFFLKILILSLGLYEKNNCALCLNCPLSVDYSHDFISVLIFAENKPKAAPVHAADLRVKPGEVEIDKLAVRKSFLNIFD